MREVIEEGNVFRNKFFQEIILIGHAQECLPTGFQNTSNLFQEGDRVGHVLQRVKGHDHIHTVIGQTV